MEQIVECTDLSIEEIEQLKLVKETILRFPFFLKQWRDIIINYKLNLERSNQYDIFHSFKRRNDRI